LGILAFVLAIAIAFAVLPPDTYRATAEMSIDMEGPDVDLLQPIVLTNYADQYIKSLEQKVMTNENLRRWLEESGAYGYEGDGLSQNELIARMRGDIQVRMVLTSIMEQGTGKEVDLITGFTTSFTARDPGTAEFVANSAAKAFLEADHGTRMAKANAASSFLREQIDKKRGEIAKIEKEIALFKQEHAGSMPDLLVLNMTELDRTTRELEEIAGQIRT
ncbi:MAG: hypothetical protein ACREH3_11355, partial [Geminicoccales bacterium]